MNIIKRIRLASKDATLSLGFLLVMLPFFAAAPAYASSNACTLSSRTFFGIPTWYEYLSGHSETITTTSGTSTTCSPQFNQLKDIWLIVAAVVDMLLYIGGIGAVLMVIYGGVRFTTSMGNPEATAQARNTIIYSVAGLLIAISASFLVAFIAKSVGGA